MTAISPLKAGVFERCITCGEGRVYSSYLKIADECPHCGQNFRQADTADGPAFFVSFAALILFAPFMFLAPMAPVSWLIKVPVILLIAAATIGFCLWSLPKVKALMLALQIRHKAGEAGFESPDN